ncbi:glycoside hydrolase family 93 protein [Cladorrhinum sp. PSN259]|nr:glycoside hydrolase family 93 protein [Cladorrhinum sp. PSN259]
MKIQVVDQPRLIHPGGIYIRANRLFNTTNQLIAGYATADDNSKALMASVSLDGGRSWSFRGEVTRVGNPWDHDLDNAFPLQLPSGRILFAFRNHDLHRGRYTWYRITVCASDDDGRTWKLQSHVEERKAAAGDHMRNGLWEPFMRVAADGAVVQLYYSASVTSRSQYNVMRYSRDGGRTWSGKKIDVSHGPDFWSNNWKDLSRDGMISIAPRTGKPGELIAIMESTMAETMTYSITTIESDDDGWKWRHNTSDRSLIYAAHAKKNAGAPGIINVGGTLVASFMTNEAERTPGIDGGELKFIVSVDGGKTWSSNGAAKSQDWGAAFTVAGGGVHWPGLCALNGTHFLALYSRDGLGAVSQMCRVVPVKKKELPGGVS